MTGRTQWTDDTTRRLLAMKRQGLSKTTIALRLGCSRATVRKKLQEIELLDCLSL
jgi:DNA-binding CsgD family transcriptional regulator